MLLVVGPLGFVLLEPNPVFWPSEPHGNDVACSGRCSIEPSMLSFLSSI